MKERHETRCFTFRLDSHYRWAGTRACKETPATKQETAKKWKDIEKSRWPRAGIQYSHQHVKNEGRLKLLLAQWQVFKGRSDEFNDGERAGTDPKRQ